MFSGRMDGEVQYKKACRGPLNSNRTMAHLSSTLLGRGQSAVAIAGGTGNLGAK